MVVVPCGLTLCIQIGEDQRHFGPCGDVDLGAVGPHGFDQVDRPVHFRVGVRVNQFSAIFRPISVDQHFGAVVGSAPKLLCDERHDRVQHD